MFYAYFRFLFRPVRIKFCVKDFFVLLQVADCTVERQANNSFRLQAICGSSLVRIISLLLRFGNIIMSITFQDGCELVLHLISTRRRRINSVRGLRVGRCVFDFFTYRAATRGVQGCNSVVFILGNDDRDSDSQASSRAIPLGRTITRIFVCMFTTVHNSVSVFQIGFPRHVSYLVWLFGPHALR